MKCYTVFLFIAFTAFVPVATAEADPTNKVEATAHCDARMAWFRDAKFGMFIHFGVMSQSGMGRTKEAYESGARKFNPVNFDADEWVRIVKEAGAKYIVFTSKHHDGFCNWDSALTDWDIVDQTAFKRDIIAELAAACQSGGIRLGLYYSIADWHQPDFDPKYSNRNGFTYSPHPNADITQYMKYMYGQIQELCEKYHPSLFWFDGGSGFRPPERKRLLGQPDMVELLHSHGAICNSRLGDDDGLRYFDYLSMGDNMIPASNIGVPFEAGETMNESWFFDANDKEWKSPAELLARLVDIVGKGGNYLLDVGPTELGVFPDAAVSRLKTMGDWLAKNGEAIYGSQAGPYPYALGWGSITQRKTGDNTTLYLNVVNWPKDGTLPLYGLNNRILSASLLVSGEPVKFSSSFNAAAGVNIHTLALPHAAPDPYVSVIKLTVAGPALMDQLPVQQADGVVALDGYHALMHDLEFVRNQPRHPMDFREFTVFSQGEGIMPGRGMTVHGLDAVGQALSWDFKLIKPGAYEVAVVSQVAEGQSWKAAGRMRATVAGQAVENKLIEQQRSHNQEMSTTVMDSLAVLGRVRMDAPGTHTLTLEVTSKFSDRNLAIRGVRLLPVSDEK